MRYLIVSQDVCKEIFKYLHRERRRQKCDMVVINVIYQFFYYNQNVHYRCGGLSILIQIFLKQIKKIFLFCSVLSEKYISCVTMSSFYTLWKLFDSYRKKYRKYFQSNKKVVMRHMTALGSFDVNTQFHFDGNIDVLKRGLFLYVYIEITLY